MVLDPFYGIAPDRVVGGSSGRLRCFPRADDPVLSAGMDNRQGSKCPGFRGRRDHCRGPGALPDLFQRQLDRSAHPCWWRLARLREEEPPAGHDRGRSDRVIVLVVIATFWQEINIETATRGGESVSGRLVAWRAAAAGDPEHWISGRGAEARRGRDRPAHRLRMAASGITAAPRSITRI